MIRLHVTRPPHHAPKHVFPSLERGLARFFEQLARFLLEQSCQLEVRLPAEVPVNTTPDQDAPYGMHQTARAAIHASDNHEHRAARAAMFIAELLWRIDALARSMDARCLATVAAEANALSTGASALGLRDLAAEAGRVEAAARQADGAVLDEAFGSLQCGVHAALARLRKAG